ncbi:MAG: protein kinase [Myxococcota bacterium]
MTAPPIVVPDEVGPYRVLRPLARGGMAEVYEVADQRNGEHLALKVLVQTGGALARFNREYEAMIRLNHPNIVRVYSYGVLTDRTRDGRASPWLSMELIEGTPIQAYAKKWGKPGTAGRLDEVARASHDLALALDHIHHRGLVHRDLKSANVLVLPDGRVKLIDFGTARVSDAVEDITRDGEFIGTFAYASPEQLLNVPIDGRSDLYSLGVLLYRLVTGRRPFETEDIGELARMHVRMEPPRPSNWVPDLAPAFEALILALLAKDPANRPQTGAEVAHALEAAAGHPLYLSGALELDRAADPLVGREDQLRTLWRFFEGQGRGTGTEAGRRPGDMALLVGLQGSGRHQIVQWMERYALERGWSPLTVFFRRGADDLDQFTQALSQLARSFGADASQTVLEAAQAVRLVERSPGIAVSERLAALRIAAADLLRERASLDGAPVIVFVRGLQHAGPVGFEALVALREQLRLEPAPVLFLADCTESTDDPRSISRKRLPDAVRVHLPPMNVRQVALLVGALLHRRPPPAGVARQIFVASGGLPTYVEDVVKRLVAGGLLRAKGHDQNRIAWAQSEDIEIPVPEGARDRLMDELATLPVDRRRCLETLALCGGEGAVRLIASALQCFPADIAPALRDLEDRGWVTLSRVDNEPYARWRQILAEGVVLEQLHPCRRKVLENLLIEQVADQPAYVAQVRLLVQSGRYDLACLRARDWAIHQLAKHRPVTALEALDLVVPHLDSAEGLDNQMRAHLFLLHATSLLSASPTDPRTSRSLLRAQKLSPTGDPLEAEISFIRAQIQQLIGHYPNFRKALLETWHLVEHEAPGALAAMTASLLGWSTQMDGAVDEAASWHGRARRIALSVDATVARASADLGVASWQLARGLLVEAERTSGAALTQLQESGDLRGISVGIPILTEALWYQGRFSDAIAVLEAHLVDLRECEIPTFYVRALLAAAAAEVGIGRLGRAQEYVDELGANLRRGEHLDLRLQADLAWGRIQVASGLYADAVAKLREVEDRARAAGLTVVAESAAAIGAEGVWALGDQKGALVSFRKATAKLQQTGDVPALTQAIIAQGRAMSESVDPDLVYRPIDDWLVSQPAVVVRIERQIARGRYLKAMGRPHHESFDDAQSLIEDLTFRLTETDAAALRLHPWTRWIRRARKARR